MKKIFVLLIAVVIVIGLGACTNTAASQKYNKKSLGFANPIIDVPEDAIKIPEGEQEALFLVGRDIKSGMYIVVATKESSSGFWATYKDDRGEPNEKTDANDLFDYFSYVVLKDGYWLKLSLGANAFPAPSKLSIEAVNGVYPPGIYRIGTDLVAGTYSIKVVNDNHPEWRIFKSVSDTMSYITNAIDYDLKGHDRELTLKNGEVLVLDDMTISSEPVR